jgi:hypothetical protein
LGRALVAAIWNSQEEGAGRQRGPLSCRASVRAIRSKLTGSRPSTADSTGWVHEEGDNLVFDYIMDMEDATSEKFLERLGALRAEGHPMRPEAVQAFADDNVRLPDLRPLSFRRPKALLPFMAKASRAGPDQ